MPPGAASPLSWPRCCSPRSAIVFTPSGVARADTVFQSGQVFASVGFSQVGVYDATSGNLDSTLTDDTGEPFTTGSAFDSSGNFYVTDDTQGDISEFSPTGQALGQFATGLTNPESLVFDNQGNLYVGQQTTPYIAEFSPSGQGWPTSGRWPTELYGDDWIDLSSDQCTFYYTSEGTDIMRYNKCTNTQESNFNQVPFTGYGGLRGPHPRRRERPRGGLRLRAALGPERQRDPDLLVRLATRLPGPALRRERRPRRHFVLDR